MTPKQYLESALAPLPGKDRGTVAKNQIRESIVTLFPERDCFALVRPVSDEKQLQALDSVPASQLRPEFRQVRALSQAEHSSARMPSADDDRATLCSRRCLRPADVLQGLEQLTALMFSKAGPKRLGQDMVSGGVLAALTTAYVDAINGGAVPTIATAWQVCTAGRLVSTSAMAADQVGQLRRTSTDSTTLASKCLQGVAEAECRRAADAAEQAYVAAFSKDVEPDEGALEVEHRRALDAAAAAYEVAHDAGATAYHVTHRGGCPDVLVQRYALAHIGSMPAPHECWDVIPVDHSVQAGAIGEAAVRRAGDERWRAAVAARFQQVKQSRLASAALACEQLINQATTRLTQVGMQPVM